MCAVYSKYEFQFVQESEFTEKSIKQGGNRTASADLVIGYLYHQKFY